MGVDRTRPARVRGLLPALGILLITWVLLWLAQGIPTVCALAHPCPAEDARAAPALLFGGLMLAPVAVLAWSAFTGRPRAGWVTVAASAVLVGLALTGLVTVLFSGGFAVPLP